MRLLQVDPEEAVMKTKEKYLKKAGLSFNEVDGMLATWYESKQSKDFAKADEIRNTLSEKGISVSDRQGIVEWDILFKK
jgi:cysteinyl-tRNA synthetase